MEPRDCTLDDGTRVHIRDIRPDDADELRRGFEALSPESRYRRFLGGVTSLSPAMLRYLTDVDGIDHVAIVATVPDGAAEHGIGVARFVRVVGQPNVAEVAITVVDDMQGKGLGRTLGMILAELAQARGIEHFRGEILIDNAPCRELLRDLGAVTVPTEGGRVGFDVPLAGGGHPLTEAARRVLRASVGGLLGSSARGPAARVEGDGREQHR